jgi:translation initiation factor IF-2
MDKRLVKVAKELNVGTSTIVEYLAGKGYDVENKPTAKITDEMYTDLLKEFQGSIAVKEQADQLVIGNRPLTHKDSPDEKESATKKPRFSFSSGSGGDLFKPKTQPTPIEDPVEDHTEVLDQKEQTSDPTPVQENNEVEKEKEKEPTLGIKVIGKINLDDLKKPKTIVPPAPKKEEEVVSIQQDKPEEITPIEEKIVEVPSDSAPENIPVIEEGGPKPEEMMRAETPQLKGLKIMGKIDTDKFLRPKKKEPIPPAKPVEAAKPKTDPAAPKDDADKFKRKRKRKKIAVENQPPNRPPQQGTKKPVEKKDEVKEVSQKEIDEKIKATMARLNLGGKNKRQKIRKDNRERLRERGEMQDELASTEKLEVTEFISVSELASLLNVSVTQVITTCMNLGVIVSINQRLDAEIIELVASEFNQEVQFISAEDTNLVEDNIADDPSSLEDRAPIVTVMGHVDHGKTSLLDYIRSANVASGEAGGITQHIGAYEVKIDGRKITFLDTPGHEAFTAMRARGAKVTDVAVIIIAADDSIMPQTKEAISHAQAAGVPIIFAINKIDKAGADPERIKNELAQMNFLVEEWGGKYQSQEISAKAGTNIELLLEKILLESDILELKANPNRPAIGTVLEASLEKGRGYVTKMLVSNGTLEVGQPIVAGEYAGKVKAMFNERGKKVKQAGPSTPVLVLGLSGAPQAGEIIKVTNSDSDAKVLAAKRGQINREQATRASKRISLDEIGRRLALGTFKELNLIVKGDMDGSIEALSDSLIKLSVETIQVNVIHKAVGQIIESDVLLASASDAIIVGFQVRPSVSARRLAEKEGVQIKLYSIIYEAIEEIKSAMEGMLEPTKEENIVAQVLVRETFKISKLGTIAGGYVEEGKINKNNHIRIIRDGIVIYPTKEGVHGELSSLKRFKDDVKEVRSGMECGITIKNFNDIKIGDIVEGYEIKEVKQTLS